MNLTSNDSKGNYSRLRWFAVVLLFGFALPTRKLHSGCGIVSRRMLPIITRLRGGDGCCQYALANEGSAYPLKLILRGKLPQVCAKCSATHFGEVFNVSRADGSDQMQREQCAQSILSGKKPGRDLRSMFIFSSDASTRNESYIADNYAGTVDRAIQASNEPGDSEDKNLAGACAPTTVTKKAVRRSQNAKYAASLRESVRPLVSADLAAQDPNLQAIILSQIPMEYLAKRHGAPGQDSLRDSLHGMCTWFRAKSIFTSCQSITSHLSQVAHEVEHFFRGEMSVAIAFAAALRVTRIRCRIVNDVSDVVFMSGERILRNRTKTPAWWIEVWDEETKEWLCVDPGQPDSISHGVAHRNKDTPNEQKLGDESSNVESGQTRWNSDCTHVIAAETGIISDSTRRYVRLWETVEVSRPPGWQDVMQEMCEEASSRQIDPGDMAFESEKRQFSELGSQEELPRSISALRRHPLFVLKRLLRKNEVLREGIKPVATLVIEGKADAVYSRQHVEMLRTRDEWRRLLRSVRKDERPVKTMDFKTKDVTGCALSKIARMQRQETCQLFGEWQTEALDVGKVTEDGRVPSNEQGYIELLTRQHLPSGCAHIEHDAAAPVARSLRLDYAPAMVGKIAKNGFNRPIFQGIIIRKEFEDQVRQGCIRRERRKQADTKQVPGSQEKTLADFRRLVLQVLSRVVASKECNRTALMEDTSLSTVDKYDDALTQVGDILVELESQLLAIRDGRKNLDLNSYQASVLGKEEKLIPDRIYGVLLIIKQLGIESTQASGTISALGLAVSRLRVVLRGP